MTQDELKQAVAKAAFDHIEKLITDDAVIGVGTGSTANLFIEELARIKGDIKATVASSEETARRLQSHGIPVYDLNSVNEVTVYVDGADETNEYLQLIKGGGAALTREKVIAAVAREFCLHSRWQQVGGCPGCLSAPGRSHSHGPQPCRSPDRAARR